MSKNLSQTAKNIRTLRLAHKERQEDLEYAINATASQVAQWEGGHREPQMETLKKIAQHYRISVEQLVNQDLSDFCVNEQILEKEKIQIFFKKSFPIFSSAEALKNNHFRHAYHKTELVLAEIIDGRDILTTSVNHCLEQYLECWEESKTPEALANTLCLIHLIGCSIVDSNIVELGNAIYHTQKSKKELINKYYLRDLSDTSILQEIAYTQNIKKEFANDCGELITECIRLLKENSNWSALGDYYIALGYLLNLVPSDFDEPLNIAFGNELMISFAKLKNIYAENFLSNYPKS